MSDEYKLITDKQKELKPIFDRMDKDQDLYFLKPYEMMCLPPDDKRKADDVANITLNDPLLFATKAIAIIGGATMQTVVEGRDMSDKKTTKIEQFLEDVYYMVDELLVKRGIMGLDTFINEQICVRGRIAARSCIRLESEGEQKGNLIPDVLPLDTRHFTPQTDNKGMVWGAPDFRRAKAQIQREYPEAKSTGDYAEVVDFWSSEKNIVFVEKRPVTDEKNRYGYPPFVQSICPIGSMFSTEDALKHQGESIFWTDRDLWPEMNRAATVLQTLTVNSLFQALQYENTKAEGMTKPAKSPYKGRTVHGVPMGGGYKLMPVSDIKAAASLFYSILEGRLQRGSLSAIDYGSLTFPLSAIAITRLSGQRDDIFLPRVQAKAVFYQALSRMIIVQCIALNQTLHLGQSGKENSYSKSDLEGDYSIKYRFFTDSKERTAADLSIANAARGFLPDDYIRREIMKVQDPDGMTAELLSEQAERTDEVLFLFRRAHALIDDADKKQGMEREIKDEEARILAYRIVKIIRDRQAMDTLSPIEGKGQKTPQGKPVVPLFGGGGGTRSRESALPTTPTEETEEAKSEQQG